MSLLRTLAFCAALLCTPAFAGDTNHSHHGMAKAGDLAISGAYARATIGRAPNSAAYLEIASSGGADRLLSAESPAAKAVELHTTIKNGDIMQMTPIDALDVPAGGTAALAPGGAHVMLIGLTEPLKEGAMISLTLTFETAGKVDLMVPVKKLKRGGHKHGGHNSGDHSQGSGS